MKSTKMHSFFATLSAFLLALIALTSCSSQRLSPTDRLSYKGIKDEDIVYTLNLSDYGITADNKSKAKSNTEIINKAINNAKPFTRIVIPEGTYYIQNRITLSNKENIILCGTDGSTLINTAYSPIKADDLPEKTYLNSNIFHIENCRNVTVSNIVLDYINHTTIDGVITFVENGKTTFEAFGEFLDGRKNPVSGNEVCFSALAADDTVFYTEAWLNDGSTVVKENGQGVFSIPAQVGKIGDRISCRISSGTYSAPLFFVTDTTGLDISSITCHSCPTAFIYAPYGNSNFNISHLNIGVEENSQRLLASNEDIIHIKHMSGYLNVSDSSFSGLGDDVLNVHTKLAVLSDINENEARALTAGTGTPLPDGYFCENQLAEFFDASGCSLGTSSVVSFKNGKIQFESIPEEVTDGCFVQNISCGPDTCVTNCSIDFGRARGLLLQTKNATVENCSFSNLRLSAILVSPDFDYWYEAGYSDNVEISSNNFNNCASLGNGFGVIHIGTSHDNPASKNAGLAHKNITLSDNTFIHCKSENVKYTGVKNFVS